MAEVDRLGALQVRVAGQRPVEVLLRAREHDAHQLRDRRARDGGALAREHREVGHDLVVARAGGVELAADRPGELGQAPLDRHVDVLVVRVERKAPVAQLELDGVEAGQQRVAILGGDDLPRGQHARVRARLRDVLRPQPPVEVDRRVQALEVGMLGLVEARHGRSVYASPHSGPECRQPELESVERLGQRPTRATWPSLISGKNGSASERAATSSQTGNSPSRWPKRSR